MNKLTNTARVKSCYLKIVGNVMTSCVGPIGSISQLCETFSKIIKFGFLNVFALESEKRLHINGKLRIEHYSHYRSWAKTIMKNTNSTQNKSQTHRAEQYKVKLRHF